jgi:hypothetical protein
MAEFAISIIETVHKVYVFDARSATDAGIQLGVKLAEDPYALPTYTRVTGRKVMSAKRVVADETLPE